LWLETVATVVPAYRDRLAPKAPKANPASRGRPAVTVLLAPAEKREIPAAMVLRESR